MITLDSGNDVRIEVFSGKKGSMAVNKGKEIQFPENIRVSVQHPGDIHHLSETEHPILSRKWCKITCTKDSTPCVTGSCRDTGGEHDEEVKGE
jgi:hypothetical protein